MTCAATTRVLSCALLAVAIGCRSEPDTPEAQVRAWVARAEEAAEQKDAAAVKGLVSEHYRDDDGLDRQTLMAIVLRQFMQHRSIHVLTRIHAIAIESDTARCVVFAAMAGRPIPSAADLAMVRADVYRFEIELAQESPRDWKLVRAAWRPAEIEDLD